MSVSNFLASGASGDASAASSGVGRLNRAARAVLPALANAAERTGVDFNALFHTARLESGFNPQAKAATSTATGLFQFVEGTWLNTLARHGARHGITAGSRAEALALRRDPAVASLMAAEHMADNAAKLEARLGRPVGTVDLYLAHFLGVGGAVSFLHKMAQSPDSAAADLLPAAARANRSIFFAGSAPRTLGDVYALFARRLGAGTAPSVGAEGNPARRQMMARAEPGATVQSVTMAPVAPAAAARIAYLLLAELGA
jgi:hypothetical protein